MPPIEQGEQVGSKRAASEPIQHHSTPASRPMYVHEIQGWGRDAAISRAIEAEDDGIKQQKEQGRRSSSAPATVDRLSGSTLADQPFGDRSDSDDDDDDDENDDDDKDPNGIDIPNDNGEMERRRRERSGAPSPQEVVDSVEEVDDDEEEEVEVFQMDL